MHKLILKQAFGRAMRLLALLLCGAIGVHAQTPDETEVTPSASSASTAAPPAAVVDLWQFDIEGNTLLDEDTVEAAVEPFLGPRRKVEDVDRARAALEQVYQDHGYKTVSVVIPKQRVRNGLVRLKVVEMPIGRLRVVGAQYHTPAQIKAEAPALAEGTVPNFNEVQKDIVALNQQPDSQVTPALKAGAAPGTVDVDLAVSDKLPLHGSLEVNNRRSQDTSELRSAATLSYDNLWQLGHSLTLSYQTAPQNPSDARVFYASYLARFGASPFNLLINGIKSDSNVSTVGGTEVLGRGEVAGIRGVWALPQRDRLFQSLTFGADYKHFKNRTSLGGQSFETPVTYYPMTLGYAALKRWIDTSLQLSLSASLASPQLGSTTEDLSYNRDQARGQQFYLRESTNLQIELPAQFQAVLRVDGQWTDQPLISNEQFSAGGMNSVRGYLEAEVLGDYGFSGGAELHSPSLASAVGLAASSNSELRLVAFTDGAELRLHEALPEQQSQFSLVSVGAGIRLSLFGVVDAALFWADPLQDAFSTRAWTSRVLFSVSGNF